ncbi:hydrogenase 4 subunit D [Eggerthellaceae bacterium zg-1084]|uniref:hydrogenase 4 subunit D n=1 Tax=Berryella wangjianweii TaxID=2734634 RepID=UPI0015530116|nr:hydrogenase 4 subunit D [Berryella wangjianweii]NPD30777.1 hydrogenase 4 subunit D [Berryella wangjianweii]
MVLNNLTLLAMASVLVPFVAAGLIVMIPQKYAKTLCIGAAAVSTALTLAVWNLMSSTGAESLTVTFAALGNTAIFGFVFDKVSVLLAPCFVGIGLLISIYSVGYLNAGNREHADAPRRRFYAFFTVFIGAMAGFVYSSTILGQLLFFEVTGACSWALIGYYDTATARKSAMKALILTHIASLGLYAAAGILFLNTGTFDTSALVALPEGAKTAALLLILMAAWGKSAQLPFYMWLPSAMEAPTPVSAYLHGASMVKVGVALFARALIGAGPVNEVVGWVVVIGGILTCLFAFLMYLPQKDMKRLLAFSTISQLAYIFLGFGFYIFGSGLAFEGSVAHIFNHAFTKTLFFLVAGAFSYTMGTRMLPQIKGVLKKQPLLAIGFGVGAFAIAGAPPMNLFFSKYIVFCGGIHVAEGNPILMAIVIIALIETVGCFAWFLKWAGSVLPGEPSEVVANSQPVPKAMAGVLVVLIVMVMASSYIAAAWLG